MTNAEVIARALMRSPGRSQEDNRYEWSRILRVCLDYPETAWRLQTISPLRDHQLVRIRERVGRLIYYVEVTDSQRVRDVIAALEHPNDWNTP